MDEMLRFHSSEEPNFILHFAFKCLLPAPVRHALSTFPSISLNQWAKEDDRLMADHNDQRFTNVAAVRSLSPAHPLPPLLLDAQPIVTAANSSNSPRRKLVTITLKPPWQDSDADNGLLSPALWHECKQLQAPMHLAGKLLGGCPLVAA